MRLFLVRHSCSSSSSPTRTRPSRSTTPHSASSSPRAAPSWSGALPARRAGTPVDARPGTPVDAALGAIGDAAAAAGARRRDLDALPRFDDTSGAALNAAAAQLVEGTGRNVPRGAMPPLPTLRAAEFADGLWKYVLLEVTDAGGASRAAGAQLRRLCLPRGDG